MIPVRKCDWRYREIHAELWLWSERRCWFCGATPRLYDRNLVLLQPRSRGGERCYSNLALGCAKCRTLKWTRTLEEFRHMRSVYEETPEIIFYGEKVGLILPYVPQGKPMDEHPWGWPGTSDYRDRLAALDNSNKAIRP